MRVLKITVEYFSKSNTIKSLDDENDNISFLLELLLLSIPGSVLLLSLISLIIRTMPEPLLFDK